MFRLIVSLFLVSIIASVFSREQHTNQFDYRAEYIAADQIFQKAEQIASSPNYTEATAQQEEALNQQALKRFRKLLPAIERAQDDSLSFFCCYKIGVLEHYFDSLDAAKYHYQKAIAIQARTGSLPDSVLFKPLLFLGGIQYNNNQFDSALIHYKKAEAIAARYTVILNSTNRLYNTLGAMYYETGNYSQAKNYFEKAIALLGSINSSNEGLMINYQVNLASTLTKLEDFNGANTIYQQLLRQEINKNDVLHNLGTINLRLGAARQALEYLRQVHYTNNKIVRLKNDIGQAYENLGQMDSALAYFRQATDENKKWNRTIKNVQAGLTLKYLGDINYKSNEPEKALEKYQQAIIQLVSNFNSGDIYSNPQDFSTVFSYINLFNILTAKADAFEKRYPEQKETKQLEAALASYRVAFKLADFVERTYDSDEARLFLNKIKYTVHSKPIDLSIQLFELTGKKEFLEEAYLFDQRNKASILSLNVQQNELRNLGGHNDLFQKESLVKATITRLTLKASQTTDSSTLADLNTSIRDQEIELGRLQDQIAGDPAFKNKLRTDRVPPVKEIQSKLDKSTALLSYHLSETRLITLAITSDKLEYRAGSIDVDFKREIDSFKTALHAVSGDQKYNGARFARSLYRRLIQPVGSLIAKIDRLIIIPDDELTYLPFEALQNESNEYLVQQFSIGYLYSTAFFEETRKGHVNAGTIAFAPFTKKGYADSSGITLASLPASAEEVKGVGGLVFSDSLATKQKFIETADQFGILHLATHASVNNEAPLRSFITFFPGKNAADYKLYAAEIYNMDLDSTQLVILSACETGTGQLIRGEGLMSLSRAFAYAGCPNIITSLWKAEDKTTAFIAQAIHKYLEKGFSKDKALQKAKLDLLNSNEIDPRLKTPNYWAHLVFIGQYSPDKSHPAWWLIVAGIIITLIVFLTLTIMKR